MQNRVKCVIIPIYCGFASVRMLATKMKKLNVRCKDVKKGIHPDYKDAVIRCACGAEVKTKSTSGDMHVDICSKCHPFFTGKQKFVDAGGRVDKFKKRLEAAGK